MATEDILSTLSDLRDSSAPATAQVAALKALRNEVIGHSARKASLVRQGLFELLPAFLNSSSRGRGKQRTRETNGAAELHQTRPTWSDQDDVCLQTLIILSSIASGGPAFVAPFRASGIIQQVGAFLSPSDYPAKIVHAALKVLVTICEVASLAQSSESVSRLSALDFHTSGTWLTPSHVEILSQNSSTPLVQAQVSLVAQLIHHTASFDQDRAVYIRAGVLDLLAARLAAYYETQALSSHRTQPAQSKSNLPPPPTRQMLPHIFQAINTLIQKSRYRIARLLYSPFVLSVLPLTPASSTSDHALGSSLQRSFDHVELLLPKIHTGSSKEDRQHSKAFPALGAVQQKDHKYAALLDFEASGYNTPMRPVPAEFQESSMISWLIFTLRSEQRLARIEAANLLTTVARAGFLGKGRDRQLALLVVPLLTAAMDQDATSSDDRPDSTPPEMQAEARSIRSRAPRILAELIKDSPRLQEAAVDGKVIPKVTRMLKDSFGPVDAKIPIWSAEPMQGQEQRASAAGEEAQSPRRLGSQGIRPDILHIFKCRESALVLVAALAEKEDKHRKLLTDQGIVASLVDSLVTIKEDAVLDLSRSTRRDRLDATYGNPASVLLAACNAAMSLSRSPFLLRTSLIDACLATPICALLSHPNVLVLIAATEVVINLVTEVSPMRQGIIDQGAIKTLCEHAHSADSRIRSVSLWALKHLVCNSSPEVKEQTFETLGTGWLTQIITGNSAGASASTPTRAGHSFSMGVANAAGERVDILNATEEPMDTGRDYDPSLPTHAGPDGGPPSDDELVAPIFAPQSDLATLAGQHRQRLVKIREEEQAMAAKAHYRDEQQIQVHGLDFVRNLIQGSSASAMIEMLFNSITAERIFDMVAAKFRPAGPVPANAAPHTPAPLQSATEVVVSAVFVCVHIAAGDPKHRQQLMSQPDLLRLMLPLLQHPDSRVRVSCVWCITNLTWVDDQNDAPAARRRAFELRAMGFEDELRALHADDDMDVRERARNAVDQIANLVSGEGGGRRVER